MFKKIMFSFDVFEKIGVGYFVEHDYFLNKFEALYFYFRRLSANHNFYLATIRRVISDEPTTVSE